MQIDSSTKTNCLERETVLTESLNKIYHNIDTRTYNQLLLTQRTYTRAALQNP